MNFKFKFFPQYQFLFGINVHMCETFEISTEKTYDTVEIDIGLAVFVLSVSIITRKKESK